MHKSNEPPCRHLYSLQSLYIRHIFLGINYYLRRYYIIKNIIPPLSQNALSGLCRLYKIINVYNVSLYLGIRTISKYICATVKDIYIYNIILCIWKKLFLHNIRNTYIGMFQNIQYARAGIITIWFIVNFNCT